jgi:hypothetical protein
MSILLENLDQKYYPEHSPYNAALYSQVHTGAGISILGTIRWLLSLINYHHLACHSSHLLIYLAIYLHFTMEMKVKNSISIAIWATLSLLLAVLICIHSKLEKNPLDEYFILCKDFSISDIMTNSSAYYILDKRLAGVCIYPVLPSSVYDSFYGTKKNSHSLRHRMDFAMSIY